MDRLEFREFRDIPKFQNSEYWIPFDTIQPTITQLFARRYIQPGEHANRYIFKMGTGTGKTLTSLLVAQTFAKVYENYHSADIESPNIIIVGFSEAIYKREFLKFTDLGFITQAELSELEILYEKVKTQSAELAEYTMATIRKIRSRSLQRITNKSSGGFYKFYGYQQLFNHLFKGNIPEGVSSHNIHTEYLAGNVLVDPIVLGYFKNSFLICDEIHQSYNSVAVNNYGLAIQFLLDYHKYEITSVFLSATIINNNKREIIDIANSIKDPDTPHFHSDDFFYTDSTKLKKPLDEIYKEFQGKVIFLEEKTDDYPDLEYQIKERTTPSISELVKQAYNSKLEQNFLQFTECMFTPLQNATFVANNFFDPDVRTKFNMIHDLVVPNPDYPAKEILKYHPDHPDFKNRIPMTGLFDPVEIRQKISEADPKWMKEIGIEIKLEKEYHILSGPWLKYENLKIYSGKGVELIDTLRAEMERDPKSKILIYHPYVKDSGIITIAEILKQNGFAKFGSQPSAETYSSNSNKTYLDYKRDNDDSYRPAYFVTLSYEVKDNQMNRIIDEYNSASNKEGANIKILLGAQRIKQSIDFKDVQVQIIYAAPTNISEFIQIKGRTVRNGSLMRLPLDKRQVRLYTFCGVSKLGLTFEAKKYIKKIIKFREIQQIEQNINRSAINNYIYGKKSFRNEDPLGALGFNITLPEDEIDSNTYFFNNSYRYTYNLLFKSIKRAFIANPVWTRDGLWKYLVGNPSINIELELDPIYSEMFDYIMTNIVFNENDSSPTMVITVFDLNNKKFNVEYTQGQIAPTINRIIAYIGGYFILVPIDAKNEVELSTNSFLKRRNHDYSKVYQLEDNEKYKYKVRYDEIIKEYNNSEDKTRLAYLFLLEFDEVSHYFILRNHITKVEILPEPIFNVYKSLFLAGDNWYIDRDKKNVYEEDWQIFSKERDRRQENDVVVGIISGKTFKLREPNREHNIDLRNEKKGTTCRTNKKEVLEEYYKKLNLVYQNSQINNICEDLYIKLVDLEAISIISEDGLRYLYNYTE